MQDGVAAVRRPEIGDPRLLAQDAVRVIAAVGAAAREDPVEGQRELDHPAVLAVRPARGGAQGHERQGGDDHEDGGRDPDQRPARGRPRSAQDGDRVGQGQGRGHRAQQQRDRVPVPGRR